ncbi:MAG: hypothetical protein H7833_17740 [Magnetococcus sp. DMHC-1]|nr:hypothetical protein [Magnetococcales bacterium]
MPDAGSDELTDQLQQQAVAWSSAFAKSDHFASLTDTERHWAASIILEFVQAMHLVHNRPVRRWTAQSITECCTRTLPARVTAPEDFFQAVAPVLSGLILHLTAEELLTNGPVLIRALQRARPRIVAQASDPDNWNMTKTLLTHAVNKGHDPKNPHDMEAFLDRIHAGEIPEILPFPGRHGRRASPPAIVKQLPVSAKNPQVFEQLQTMVGRIAQDLAKNRSPDLTDELVTLLEQHPNLLLDMLSMLATRMQNEEEVGDDPTLEAWFMILGFHLEQIRYGMERNFTWAMQLIATFQTEAARMAREESLSPMLLNAVISSLHEARLQPAPELLDVYESVMEKAVPTQLPTAREMQGILDSIFADADDDVFQVHAQMDHMLRMAPPEMQTVLVQELERLQRPTITEALALFVVHPQAVLRQIARDSLLRISAGITPDTLRRLIVLRNWIPPAERPPLDQTIRTARQRGVPCAQWPGGESVVNRYALTMDGGGAMGFFLLSRTARQQRLSSVLAKSRVGILDAWSGEALSQSTMRRQVRDQITAEGFQTVSALFPTLVVKHHLQVGLEQGQTPPAGLLQVAETVAATDWQPDPVNLAEWLQTIRDAAHMQKNTTDKAIIQSSHIWSREVDIVQSWYMESQALVDYLHAHRHERPATLRAGIIKEFFEPARQEWAERFAWTALWLHEQPPGKNRQPPPLAAHFALLGQILLQEYPLARIPFMELMAIRTIEALQAMPPF